MELIRFQRGELNMMNAVSPEIFDQLQARMPAAVRDLGPSLESEMMWFNQSPKAPFRLTRSCGSSRGNSAAPSPPR